MSETYEKIKSFENLHKSYKQIRRGKRYYKKQQQFELHLERNLIKLQDRLKIPNDFKPQKYTKFTITEPKKRAIAAPSFDDRIIYQAIFRVIEPTIRKNQFIPTTYACIKNRGTHKAVRDIQESLQKLNSDSFFLKGDMYHYFSSINHTILKQIIKKTLKDEKTLTLLNRIIDSYEESPDTGLPLGNVTSQLFANLYLSELDHFINNNYKSENFSVLFRYMDDFILLANDKKKLLEGRESIKNFIGEKLKLKLHPKKVYIQRTSFGIDFCGYRIFADKILMRKKTLRRYIRRYKKMNKKINFLQNELKMELFPEINENTSAKINQIEEKLANSLNSHLGFLQHSKIDFSEEFAYSSNIRLPYSVKVCTPSVNP